MVLPAARCLELVIALPLFLLGCPLFLFLPDPLGVDDDCRRLMCCQKCGQVSVGIEEGVTAAQHGVRFL